MNKRSALELLEDLGGDEHAWVDFKEDYKIGGIAPKKAEFIKDISSLANTITDRKKHYIFVGVADDGDIVGVSSDAEQYSGSGPRHIFSYDESDVQEIVDENLEHMPQLMWHTYAQGGDEFGVLEVEPLRAPPTITTQDLNDDYSNRVLHRGLVYVRKGSGKKIATREEVERIIEYRIEAQRNQILDGIQKAISIGPEWVDRIGQALPEESGVPLNTTEDPEEADVEVTQRITREPASTLDENLNEDISQWKGRGDDFIDHRPLYEYYSNPGDLRLDDIALKFLAQSALKNDLLGIFWLHRTDSESIQNILLSTPNKHHRIERAGSVLLLMSEMCIFDELMEQSSTNAKYGHLKQCKQKMNESLQNRVTFLLKSSEEYSLKYNSWKEEFSPKEMSIEQLRETIPEVAEQLIQLQKLREKQKAWNKCNQFRDALWDLEVVLGAECIEQNGQ